MKVRQDVLEAKLLVVGWHSALGYESDAIGDTVGSFLGLIHPDDLDDLVRCLRLASKSGNRGFEIVMLMRASSKMWELVHMHGQLTLPKRGTAILTGSLVNLTRELSPGLLGRTTPRMTGPGRGHRDE